MSNFDQLAIDAQNKFDYTLTGANSQILSVNMKTHAAVTAEPGVMMMMSSGIKTSASCGNPCRMCVGESCISIEYINRETEDGFVALTPNFPGKIVPVDLSTTGKHLIARGGAYMAHCGQVSLTADFDCNCCRCCCGGMGFARQSITGDGTVFLAAGGTIITKVLGVKEKIVVDTESIVAYEHGVTLDFKAAGGCCTMCCGGEGMFNSSLTGPGLVVIQSMSFEKYKDALRPPEVVAKK